jgi:hypothetical protein
LMTSSDRVGRCEISMVFLLLLLGTRYLMPLRPTPAVQGYYFE